MRNTRNVFLKKYRNRQVFLKKSILLLFPLIILCKTATKQQQPQQQQQQQQQSPIKNREKKKVIQLDAFHTTTTPPTTTIIMPEKYAFSPVHGGSFQNPIGATFFIFSFFHPLYIYIYIYLFIYLGVVSTSLAHTTVLLLRSIHCFCICCRHECGVSRRFGRRRCGCHIRSFG